MADGFLNQMLAARDPALADRLLMALAQTAQNVYSEGSTVAGHAARAALATRVALNISPWLPIFSILVGAEGVDTTSPDTTISNAVSAVWNLVAGA